MIGSTSAMSLERSCRGSQDTVMKGIIVKIKLRNFVSYDYIEIFPGPKLNLILGPNGAGKSSIVSAIVLCLGGTPKDLGRDVNVKDFIKNGKSVGKVELELFNPGGNNIIVSRTLSQARSTSAWKINRKAASLVDIQELTKSLNIQVDNLCQILPQEKVLDFSRMNPQTLLMNTEKAIGPVELCKYHEKLIRFTVKIRGNENELGATKEKLELLERECEKLRSQVDSLKERETQSKLIKELSVKCAWLAYYRERELQNECKAKLEESKNCLEECRSGETRFVTIKDNAEKKASSIRNEMKSTNSTLGKNSALIDRISTEIDETQNTISRSEEELRLKIDEEKRRNHELEMVQQHINKMENDQLAFQEPDESATLEIKNYDAEIRSHREAVNRLESDIAIRSRRSDEIRLEIKAQDAAREKAKNVKRHREKTLARSFPDVHRAVLWLRENKHLFSGNVFEPMLLEINIPKPEHAKYFEYLIPTRDLQAFTCEDKDDMRILISKLRDELRLKVNVLHSGKEHPSSQSFHPDIPIQNLEQYGFIAYLRDLFTAPETILKYLCRKLQIHKIPLGTAKTNEVYDAVPLNIRAFFSNDTKYDVSVSKYSRERCTTATSVTDRGFLKNTINMEELRQADVKLASLQKERDVINQHLSTLEEKKQEIESIMNAVKEKRKALYERVNARNEFMVRLRLKKKHLVSIREDLSKIVVQMGELKSRIISAIQQLCNIMRTYQEAMKNHLTFMKKTEKFEFQMVDARREFSQANIEIESLRSKHKDKLTRVRVLEEEFNRIKGAAESALRKAKNISPDYKPDSNLMNSLSLEEVKKQLNEARAKVECLGHVNPEVTKQYEVILHEVDKLKQEIENNSSSINSTRGEIAGLKESWLELVNNLVQRINENFGRFFSSMGCAGEVVLSPGSDPEDFEQYGIRIRVKYHEDDHDLYYLDKNMQSGGEKTVATAIYLIAMQELTCVPFRCVDEINQGMDPINERRVFNTLVNAVHSNNSQYFFLTPKLLPDLSYSKDVTSIFIFCGFAMGSTTCDDESEDDGDTLNTSKHIDISQCLEYYQSH